MAGDTTAAGAPSTPPVADRLAVFPSKAIKPIPSFVLTVPPGWILDEAPDALTVVRPREPDDGFWVNAMVTTDRVPRALDFEKAAQITFARIQRECPDVEIQLEKMARFGSLITYLRGMELTSPRSKRRLAQVHALFFAPVSDRGKTVDMFQVVGTCPAESAGRYAPRFVEIVGSFRFV